MMTYILFAVHYQENAWYTFIFTRLITFLQASASEQHVKNNVWLLKTIIVKSQQWLTPSESIAI